MTRNAFIFSIAVLLLVLPATSAFASNPTGDRQGFMSHFAIGYGNLSCVGCGGVSIGGLGTETMAGGFLNSKTALGLGHASFSRSIDGLWLRLYTLTTDLRIYPSDNNGAYLKAGAGLTYVAASGAGLGRASVLGLVGHTGVGADLRIGEKTYFNLALSVNYLPSNSGNGTFFLNVGVGFSGYERARRARRTPRRDHTRRSESRDSSLARAQQTESSGPEEVAQSLEDCQRGVRCINEAGCLSGYFCDVEARECMQIDCFAHFIEQWAVERGEQVSVRAALTITELIRRQPPVERTEGPPKGEPGGGAQESVSITELRTRNSFTVDEAALLCGVSTDTIRGWIDSGDLRAVPVDDGYVISRRELAQTWRDMGGGELFDD